MMNKVELLAPAGNLEKAQIALLYGADAVYVGGKQFSLRARASNFSLADIDELTSFAHSLNKKVYVTMNIIPHESDMEGVDEYLIALKERNVDAIIVSSPYIISRAKLVAPTMEVHLSTQISVTNSAACAYYEKCGLKRIVLAREVTLKEMQELKAHTNIDLEVFIHGGMCSSYSGRCVLSNHMTGRDANRGGCAHSCRWNYTLYHENTALPGFFNIGSKDLMAVRYVPELLKLGISSLKIEGRMKSTYYLATVVRSYRLLIDAYYEKDYVTSEEIAFVEKEISKAENRNTGSGFYEGIPSDAGQLYDNRDERPTKEYLGIVLDYNETTHEAIIEQRNYFEPNEKVEFFGPHLNNVTYQIGDILDAETGEKLDAARHPLQKILLLVPFTLQKNDIMRKVNT